ncbi:MAG: hypothetical protein PWP57_513 [Candidatus Atribacteria bacterium]|nr:hypothetical protein [Candidatus Atribacteria bacterium]
MDEQKERLLVITGAPFLQAGNQSIRRTLSGLCARGSQIEIWLLGVELPVNYPENMVIRTFRKPFFLNFFKQLLKPFLVRHRNVFPHNRDVEQVLDYRNDEANQWFTGLPVALYFSVIVIIHTLLNRRTLKSVRAVWGYERGGVLPAKAVSKLLKAPCITSFQGTVLHFYLQRYGTWKTFLKLPLDLISTRMKADLVIMTDDGTRGLDVLKQLGHHHEKILFVPNGVDLGELSTVQACAKSDLGLEDNELLFVMSTRLVAHKRVDRALALAKALCDAGFDNFKLFIIGDGNDKSYLLSLAEMMGVKEKVVFCGAVQYRQALNMIGSADMIWSFQEGSNLTNTVQDALALGKYVLVLDDGSLKGFLEKSPDIKLEQILAVPLNGFLEKAVKTIKEWYKDYSPDIKLQPKTEVWSWEDRLDAIQASISKLLEAQQSKNAYDIILTAANAIAPFPRLERTAKYIADPGFHCLAVGWDREGRYPAAEKTTTFDIIRMRYRGQYGGGLRNLYGLFRWNLGLVFLHLKLRPKVIHAYDFDTIIPALIARVFIKCKVIYDIADWYADSRKVGRLRPFFDKVERWACRKADLVILAHEKRLQQVGFIPRKWLVIYNTPEDIYKRSELVERKPADNDYFVYVGVLHSDRGLPQIVEATSALGAKLVLAGFGPLESYCREAADTIPGIQFLGQIPYERTLVIEANAVAIIALYDPKLSNNRLAAPNKLYEAMMLGCPLITSRETLVGELVEKERIGVAVTYGDVQELSQAMNYIRSNPEEREEMGHRARLLYETQYSFGQQCEKLRKAYQELCPDHFTECRKGDR